MVNYFKFLLVLALIYIGSAEGKGFRFRPPKRINHKGIGRKPKTKDYKHKICAMTDQPASITYHLKLAIIHFFF